MRQPVASAKGRKLITPATWTHSPNAADTMVFISCYASFLIQPSALALPSCLFYVIYVGRMGIYIPICGTSDDAIAQILGDQRGLRGGD